MSVSEETNKLNKQENNLPAAHLRGKPCRGAALPALVDAGCGCGTGVGMGIVGWRMEKSKQEEVEDDATAGSIPGQEEQGR